MIPSSHYERGITQNMYFLFSADAHTADHIHNVIAGTYLLNQII